MAGQTYYVCVDSFNENGVTTGEIIKWRAEPCPQGSPAVYAGNRFRQRNEARQTLAAMKAAGYDGIELCGVYDPPHRALWCGC